jgi:hypothetical protein
MAQPESGFDRFQAREARRSQSRETRNRWLWRLITAALYIVFAVFAAKDITAAAHMLLADPQGPAHAITHAARPYWRGLALMAAAVVGLVCGGWLISPLSRGRDPELALTGMTLAILGALEFTWLSATKQHIEIGAGIAVVAIVLALIPARRRRAR